MFIQFYIQTFLYADDTLQNQSELIYAIYSHIHHGTKYHSSWERSNTYY